MTIQELLQKFIESDSIHYRLGQSVFNFLHQLFEEAEIQRATNTDPFYHDSRVEEFIQLSLFNHYSEEDIKWFIEQIKIRDKKEHINSLRPMIFFRESKQT